MSDTPNPKEQASSNDLFLNTLIGFLGVLVIALLVGLFTRIIYPRIMNERNDPSSNLISEVIQLEVLNGCGEPGVANRITSVLRKNRFDVVDTGNFENFDVKESFVISRSGNMNHAYQIARTLGISEDRVLREESPDFYLDATIVIGSDFESLNTN